MKPTPPHKQYRWSEYLCSLRKKDEISSVFSENNSIVQKPKSIVSTLAANPKRSLQAWSFYFIAKLILFGMGYITFHALENLVFAGFILLTSTIRSWRKGRNIFVIFLAMVLFYYDSRLPPFGRLISQLPLISDFSPAYLIELIFRFVNFWMLGLLLLVWGVYHLLARWIRVGVLVITVMAVLGIVQNLPESSSGKPDLDQVRQEFFARESQRAVGLMPPPAGSVPFDLVFIHVCSLSWDDVMAVGLERHPLWRRFDIRMDKFNSATSYSGPAAIRLLRATCGQQEHKQLYSPVSEKCYLMNSLLRAGFEPNMAMNHNGKFDGFIKQVQTYGRLTTSAMDLTGIAVTQNAFDGSAVYDDLEVLKRWLDTRQESGTNRSALYYNSITLHDGNILIDQVIPQNILSYKKRLNGFLDDLDQFLDSIEKSGRRMVVVMIPEHGAALRGDKRQIAGLRELPTPTITLVPVGIKIIGGGVQRLGSAVTIAEPTSYLDLSHVVARMLKKSPFDTVGYSPSEYVEALPNTPFVAQGETATVIEYKDRYYLKQGESGWE